MDELIGFAKAAAKELKSSKPGKKLPHTRKFSDQLNVGITIDGKINKDLLDAVSRMKGRPMDRESRILSLGFIAIQASWLGHGLNEEQKYFEKNRSSVLKYIKALIATKTPEKAKKSVSTKGVRIKKSKKS